MAERRLTLSPDELAVLATIVVRYPGLASTIHAQVRRLIEPAESRRVCADQRNTVDELLPTDRGAGSCEDRTRDPITSTVRPWGDAIVLVAITGYGRPEDRPKAQEASFDAHLTKPVSADELAEILSRADGEGAAH